MKTEQEIKERINALQKRNAENYTKIAHIQRNIEDTVIKIDLLDWCLNTKPPKKYGTLEKAVEDLDEEEEYFNDGDVDHM